MLDFGKADVNALDNDLMSPLHVAAIKRDADICLALVIIFNGFKFNQKITLNPLWWILAHFIHAKISCKEHVTKKKPCREGGGGTYSICQNYLTKPQLSKRMQHHQNKKV